MSATAVRSCLPLKVFCKSKRRMPSYQPIHTFVHVFIFAVQTHAWMMGFAYTAARRPASLYGLGSFNAELVSGEISAIRRLSRSARGGGSSLCAWTNSSQRDGGRRKCGGVRYGWMMTGGMHRWMNMRESNRR